MTSDRQISSNRRNAQLSTGPRTEAGKQKSARNAFKHGLRARTFILQPEDPQLIEETCLKMAAAYKANCEYEFSLIAQMVQSHRLAQQARHQLQTYFFAPNRPGNMRYIEIVPSSPAISYSTKGPWNAPTTRSITIARSAKPC